ncbi:MAG: hypothetical protein IT317_07555 [Anaerolineales bacterium]|nr:hypothetical protein [Anaerolineales bacterium]
MQAPRGIPNPPNYQAVTRTELNRLLGELTPLKLAYDQSQQPQPQGQPGGWQRGVSPKIEADYRRKLGEIEAQIRDDVDAVDALCTVHAQYVQDLVDRAKAFVASAKRSIDLTDEVAEPENFEAAARAAKAAAIALEAVAANAVGADREYGQAWFEYRSNLALPDENINKDYFEGRRKEIMARGKTITAKVAKCGQLNEQAKAYMSLSAKLMTKAAGLKAKKKETAAALLALEAKLKNLVEDGMDDRARMGWQGDGRNWTSKVRALDNMARGQITRRVQQEAEGWMSDLTSTLKIFRNQVKTMETLMTTAKKPLSPSALKKNQKVLALAEGHLQRARAILREAQEVVEQAQRHSDVIRRANVH